MRKNENIEKIYETIFYNNKLIENQPLDKRYNIFYHVNDQLENENRIFDLLRNIDDKKDKDFINLKKLYERNKEKIRKKLILRKIEIPKTVNLNGVNIKKINSEKYKNVSSIVLNTEERLLRCFSETYKTKILKMKKEIEKKHDIFKRKKLPKKKLILTSCFSNIDLRSPNFDINDKNKFKTIDMKNIDDQKILKSSSTKNLISIKTSNILWGNDKEIQIDVGNKNVNLNNNDNKSNMNTCYETKILNHRKKYFSCINLFRPPSNQEKIKNLKYNNINNVNEIHSINDNNKEKNILPPKKMSLTVKKEKILIKSNEEE